MGDTTKIQDVDAGVFNSMLTWCGKIRRCPVPTRSHWNTFPCPDAFETRMVVVPHHTTKLVLLGMGENGLAGPTLPFLPKTRGFSVFFGADFETVKPEHLPVPGRLWNSEGSCDTSYRQGCTTWNGRKRTCRTNVVILAENTRVIGDFWCGFRNGQTGTPSRAWTPLKLGG